MTVFKSQIGQDRWVREQFIVNQARIVSETSPYFVEIGAHDGIEFSNSFYFEKSLGWNGLCIEPNPTTFRSLVKNRGCHCSSFAVSDKKGEVKINFETAEHPMLAGISEQGVSVSCDTITKILESYDAPRQITYMSIDVEGHECEVLGGLDIERFQPDMFTIEHNGNADRITFIMEWLSQRGYLFRVFNWDIYAIKDWAIWIK